MKTVRLTMAQALVRFLENQYISYDGIEHPFVEGVIILRAAVWEWKPLVMTARPLWPV